MSRVKKNTNFDNNPNSIFGASKRVLQSYRKKLDEGDEIQPISGLTQPVSVLKQKPSGLALKPSIQGITTSESVDVVDNLNEFSLLIRTITQNINTADLYIKSSFKLTKKPLAGSGLAGGVKTTFANSGKPYKTVDGYELTNPEEARTYFLHKIDTEGKTKVSDADKKMLGYFGLIDPVVKPNVKSVKIIKELMVEKAKEDAKGQTKISDYYKPTAEQNVLDEEIADDEADIKDRYDRGVDAEEIVDADMGFENPVPIGLHGQAQRYDANDDFTDLLEQVEIRDTMNQMLDEVEARNYPVTERDIKEDVAGEDVTGNEDDENYQYTEQSLDNIIARQGRPEVRENYLVSLFSTIINQINKATDFWENRISPNIAYIPKLKFDSFIKSKVMDDFSKSIALIENELSKKHMKQFFDYLDEVYRSLTNSLDELFNLINRDIKRYSSGLGSMSDVAPQIMGAGFLPIPSIYGHHLGSTPTKYLM